MQTNHIKHAFNRAAHSYDQHCQLQQQTGDELLSLATTHTSDVKTFIDIGCGTGIHAESLIMRFPACTAYALDFSDKLLKKASTRLIHYPIQLIEENFDDWQWSHTGFDLIYANLALQWSTSFSVTLNKLLSLLNTQGVLAFSIPLAGTLDSLRGKFFLRTFYQMQDILNQLENNHVISNTTSVITQQYTDSLSALRSIKAVGANFVKHQDQSGLRGKQFLNQFNLTELTYVIGYFIVKRT